MLNFFNIILNKYLINGPLFSKFSIAYGLHTNVNGIHDSLYFLPICLIGIVFNACVTNAK